MRKQHVQHAFIFYFRNAYKARPLPEAVLKINNSFRYGGAFFYKTVVVPSALPSVTEFGGKAVRPAPRDKKIFKIPEHHDFPVTVSPPTDKNKGQE